MADGRHVRSGEGRDVAGAEVVDALDLQGVDDEADPRHLDLGGVEGLLGQPLALADDLLDGHRPDDRAQVPGEYPPGELTHLVLVVEEPLGCVGDPLEVGADLEGDHGLHLHGDSLLGHALLGDLGLLHREGQVADPGSEGEDEGAVAGDDPKRQTGFCLAPADQHRLVGAWYMPNQTWCPCFRPATRCTR